MVQCELAGVDHAAWRAINAGSLAALRKPCLEFRLVPSFAGSTAPPPGSPLDLHAFLAERIPAGVPAEQVMAKADSYLEQARAEMHGESDEGQ